MRKTFIATLTLLCTIPAIGQINFDGQPLSPADFRPENFLQTPTPDLEELRAEDLERDQHKEFGYRFGVEFETDINSKNFGSWHRDEGADIWTAEIVCPGAQGVSLMFSQFKLPVGAQLFITDMEGDEFIGALTSSNNKKWRSLATGIIHSERIQIQLILPFGSGEHALEIGEVVYTYRSVVNRIEDVTQRGPFGNSGDCNINVNCPEGLPWQCEKRSVALIVEGGYAICSGALVNNTAQDGTPYFLTADHCIGFSNVNNWVLYFNHEAQSCSGSNGPTTQSISGATLVASNSGSDFALLELSADPPANYEPYFSGWDRTDIAPTAVTGIHHPSGDVKKICFDTDGPYQASQSGADVWYIDEWEDGVTEGGSSGSPLYDQNHRIVGQLYGGAAACNGPINNGSADWYGRFASSWDGPSPTSRLKDWLDPMGSEPQLFGGYPACGDVALLDVGIIGISGVPSSMCQSDVLEPVVEISNMGLTTLSSIEVEVQYNQEIQAMDTWTGFLDQYQSVGLELPTMSPVLGTNTIEVSLIAVNGSQDSVTYNNQIQIQFDYLIGQEQINISIMTDDYGYETYWELREPDGDVVASGGNLNVGPMGGGDQSASEGDPGAYANNTLIQETVDFYPWGCYEFYIVDDWGDGMCCSYGNGWYLITDANGVQLAAGASFSEADSRSFGMENGLSIEEISSAFTVYPNPASDHIFISCGSPLDHGESIKLRDMSGRIVLSQASNGSATQQLDTSALSPGVYLLSSGNDSSIAPAKVIINR